MGAVTEPPQSRPDDCQPTSQTNGVQDSRRTLWAPSSPFHRSQAVCQLRSNPWGILLGETKAMPSRHELDGGPARLPPTAWTVRHLRVRGTGTTGWGSLARQAGTRAGPGTGWLRHLARPVTATTERADLTGLMCHLLGAAHGAELPTPTWDALVPLRRWSQRLPSSQESLAQDWASCPPRGPPHCSSPCSLPWGKQLLKTVHQIQ